MNLATRILGVVIFVSLLAGATYAAFQGFGTEPEVRSVELTGPSQVPSLLAGQQTPLSLGVENGGNAAAEVTMTAETDGFSFETNPAVTTVPARNSTDVNGLLTADADVEGQHNVTIVATGNGTDDRLASTSFEVTVSPPSPPEMSLDAVLPAVRPGDQAQFQAQLQNTAGAPQTVNVTLVNAEGAVEPQQVTLRPDGSGTASVTAEIPGSASIEQEVTVRARNDAGQTASASDKVSLVPSGEFAAEPLADSFTVRPGNDYTVSVAVVSNADVSGEITASGSNVVDANFTTLEPRSSAGGFVTLSVPSDAGDEVEQSFDVEVGDRTKTVTATVSTQLDGDQPTEGQQAELAYNGLVAEGGIFGTSYTGVAQGPFPESVHFQDGQQAQSMTVRIGAPQQRAPSGVVHAVENMTEGETQTITLEPEEAFGPERRTQELDATTELNRHEEVPKLLDGRNGEGIPKRQLPDQFDIENRTEGDVIDFETQAGDETIILRFKVVEMNDQTVILERVAEEGETITFYPPWPNATEVTSVNETTIVYTTTPPDSAQEEPFTWDANPNSQKAQWGNTTTVAEVNDTAILLRHQPEEGLEYTAQTGRLGQEKSFRVENVTADTITVSTPNPNPLGGETVTFDLTVTDISQAQQRRMPRGLGGR